MVPYGFQYFFLYLFMFLSIVYICLFFYWLPRRKHPYLLYFGLFLAAISINLIGIWQFPAAISFSQFIKYASYGASPFFFLFYEQIFGEGYKKLNKRLWMLHFSCWGLIMILSLLSFVRLEDMFLPYSLFNIASILYIAISTIAKAFNGNKDAKTFTVGLICLIITLIYDLSLAIKISNYAPSQTTTWGLFIFTGCLTVILMKRFKENGTDFIYEPFTFQGNPLDLKMKADSMVMHTLKNEINRLLYLNERNKRMISSIDSAVNETLGRNLETIDETLHHMNNMILAIKKTDDVILNLQNQSINEIIIETVKNLRTSQEHPNIEFEIDLSASIEAEVDPLHLKECITNLISNSIEAIEHRKGKVKIQLYIKNQHAFIDVIDNGKGIPQDLLNDVISPLFTTKKSESHYGVGLYYVYFIINNHGGTLSIPYSEIGKGTTMRIQLPIKSKSKPFWSVSKVGKDKSHAG